MIRFTWVIKLIMTYDDLDRAQICSTTRTEKTSRRTLPRVSRTDPLAWWAIRSSCSLKKDSRLSSLSCGYDCTSICSLLVLTVICLFVCRLLLVAWEWRRRPTSVEVQVRHSGRDESVGGVLRHGSHPSEGAIERLLSELNDMDCLLNGSVSLYSLAENVRALLSWVISGMGESLNALTFDPLRLADVADCYEQYTLQLTTIK